MVNRIYTTYCFPILLLARPSHESEPFRHFLLSFVYCFTNLFPREENLSSRVLNRCFLRLASSRSCHADFLFGEGVSVDDGGDSAAPIVPPLFLVAARATDGPAFSLVSERLSFLKLMTFDGDAVQSIVVKGSSGSIIFQEDEIRFLR